MSKSTARFGTVLRSRYKVIAEVVANEYGIAYEELGGNARHKYISEARQVLYFVLRHGTLPMWSYPEIGGACGSRDHTTVMSGVRKVERRMQSDERFRGLVTRALELTRGLEHWGPEPVKAPSVPPPAIPDLEVVA